MIIRLVNKRLASLFGKLKLLLLILSFLRLTYGFLGGEFSSYSSMILFNSVVYAVFLLKLGEISWFFGVSYSNTMF